MSSQTQKKKDSSSEILEEEIVEEKNLSREEIKSGIKNLFKQGKVFILFLVMIAYFFLIDILYIFHIVKGALVLLLTIPVAAILIIAYGVYINKHSKDDMK